MKYFIKIFAYWSGLLSVYHRFHNRNGLTVAMFHRVLPPSDPRFAGADPEWTMTTGSFARCLDFFRLHYRVVSPEQVFSALRGETKLPDRSLLITFDDGWSDTAEYAQPILEKFSAKALIFVAGIAVNRSSAFWEECIYSFLATNPDGFTYLKMKLEKNGLTVPKTASLIMSEKNIREIIHKLGGGNRDALETVAKDFDSSTNSVPTMIDTDQLKKLIAAGHIIGGHGMTHQPLTKLNDIDEELKNAQGTISDYLEKSSVNTMSFPHGAYSDAIIEKCRNAGYEYLFSSDAHLNRLKHKKIFSAKNPIGRIHISERAILNGSGQFQPALLATWLFLRPLQTLE